MTPYSLVGNLVGSGLKARARAGDAAKLELSNNLRKERPTDEELEAGETYPVEAGSG